MKRIFLALQLDDSSRIMISTLARQVPGARLIPSEQLHLTIRFIGEVEGALFQDIRERLHELSASPVPLQIKGVGHFPPRGKPRVLWAGVTASSELILLRNKVNRILKQCGIEPETRKYHPHVTLARLKNSSSHRVAQFLSQHSLLETPPFMVNNLTLYSSLLTSKGAVHTIEQEYPLQL